ncbi:MAG: PDZ domain-containing protein, partial [Planctomycetaceae bacterium]|nr:PDZ domain-containing protein [Planctomycetaceae bacterium]
TSFVVEPFKNAKVSAGGMAERTIDIAEFQVERIPIFKEWGINGIVGFNYLKHVTLVFPGDQETPFWKESRNETSKGARFPLFETDSDFYAKLNLPGGKTIDVLIDTGFSGALSLSSSLLKQLVRDRTAKYVETRHTESASGITKRKNYIVKTVTFAGMRFDDVIVGESTRSHVGLGLLASIRCTLDFPNKQILVDDSNLANAIKLPIDASGLGVRFVAGGTLSVKKIYPGYPASGSQIREGHQILEINGRPVQRLTIQDIRQMLSVAGESVSLKMKANLSEYQMSLKLDRPYEYPPKWDPEDPNAAPRPFPNLDEPARSN